jgi:hypothetical protein
MLFTTFAMASVACWMGGVVHAQQPVPPKVEAKTGSTAGSPPAAPVQKWPAAWFSQPPIVYPASLRGVANASYYTTVYYYPNGGIYPAGYNPTIYPGTGKIPAPGLDPKNPR